MDWAVTNYLLDGDVGDGRYIYNNYQHPTKSASNLFSPISN